MPQYLKEEVRERIIDSALDRFADDGYAGATMAAIARAAGISAGNIYRYFDSKEALLDAVLPASFVARFRALLRERLKAAQEVRAVQPAADRPAHGRPAESLLDFSIRHRRRVVLLLGRGAGTPYENVRDEVVEELMGAAIAHFSPSSQVGGRDPARSFVLEQIYRNYVDSLVVLLQQLDEPEPIRRAVAAYERYHLVGLNSFFG